MARASSFLSSRPEARPKAEPEWRDLGGGGEAAVIPEGADYHLAELRIAADPAHPAHLNPPIPAGSRVLDVGCGAGQTLLAAANGSRAVGIDLDLAALALGGALLRDERRELAHGIGLVCAAGEALPFRPGSFDQVVCRVALPYMHAPSALAEARSVLAPGGALWLTLHPFAVPWRALRRGGAKNVLYQLYVLANGLLFHLAQRQLRLPNGRIESFQTRHAIRRALRNAGFEDVTIARGRHFVATARAY